MNLLQFSMRCVCFLGMLPVAVLSNSFTIFWSTCAGPLCAGSVLDVAILSGVTLRDRKDRRVFMQNFKRVPYEGVCTNAHGFRRPCR
jgi:hypothetical protein